MAKPRLNVNIGADTKDYDKGINHVQNEAKGLGDSFKKLGGLVASVFAVDKIVGFAKQAAMLAGQLQGVEIAFKRLNNPALLGELRKATNGTISDLELMQRAVQANNFKLPLDQLATYFKFATQRAAETGESVDYLVDSIVTGIGRKSVMIMDNLGISALELQEETKKTAENKPQHIHYKVF